MHKKISRYMTCGILAEIGNLISHSLHNTNNKTHLELITTYFLGGGAFSYYVDLYTLLTYDITRK